MIQRNFNQFMNYLKDHMNRIDDILTEYSDAREAHSKLKDVYTAVHDYVSNHSDSYEFMIRYYTNLLTMTDNVRKTFDIHEKAYNLYIDPAHVHYGIL